MITANNLHYHSLKIGYTIICDFDLGNPPHIAQGNFAKINKVVLKLFCFSVFLLTLIKHNFGCKFQKEEIKIF